MCGYSSVFWVLGVKIGLSILTDGKGKDRAETEEALLWRNKQTETGKQIGSRG